MTQNELMISQKLNSLGKTLPPVKQPAANYKPYILDGDLLYVSGQIGNTEVTSQGPVGDGVDQAIATKEAEVAALNLLAAISDAVDGKSDRVVQVLRLGVYIAAAPDFKNHGQVANGVSNLLVDVFGDRGRHARTSIGVASLPSAAAVEVDAVIRLKLI
jgi:enamine deaminase RidA (YjgF/YER057c/UK114 family)